MGFSAYILGSGFWDSGCGMQSLGFKIAFSV
jgi:hypothetical protein